uniref:Uncharacterized protein n=1 Tax=Tetranychus urticae TaxID=32264 RepID=T1L031_TETUR
MPVDMLISINVRVIRLTIRFLLDTHKTRIENVIKAHHSHEIQFELPVTCLITREKN